MAETCSSCGRTLKAGICSHCGQDRPSKNGRYPAPARKPAPKKKGS